MIKKIISYDGKYPCLCFGTLTVLLDNDKTLEIHQPCNSGGCVCRDDDWNMWAETGEWTIGEALTKNQELTPQDKEMIVNWFNENVTLGCCGGCI